MKDKNSRLANKYSSKMMLDTEKMDVDLSIVKKERLELDDYGQNTGNILDNFITEHDYHDFPQSVPNVQCIGDDDVNVDWLSSFFDEPLHDHMSGLNPPLTDLVSISNSNSKLTFVSGENEDLCLDSMPIFSECYTNGVFNVSSKGSTTTSTSSPALRNFNPLLSQTKKENFIEDDFVKDDVKKGQILTKPQNFEVDKQITKTENQQKLFLFMNTPENRVKLAGTNFNIINANLLNKLSGQNNDKPMNVIQLKKCIKLNNVVKCNPTTTNSNASTASSENKTLNTAPKIILNKNNGITDILQSSLLQGIIKKEPENIEIDSGYESPNSNESPCSPPGDIDKSSYDTYIDVPPHERQPFYLSEEEKRTLIIEGLPVPTSLPLNKMEERALKKVRRKIKNKISAQESRRKKKEYMEALEKRVDSFANENSSLKKKMSNLEVANRSLILQVQKLQALISGNSDSKQIPDIQTLETVP